MYSILLYLIYHQLCNNAISFQCHWIILPYKTPGRNAFLGRVLISSWDHGVKRSTKHSFWFILMLNVSCRSDKRIFFFLIYNSQTAAVLFCPLSFITTEKSWRLSLFRGHCFGSSVKNGRKQTYSCMHSAHVCVLYIQCF